MNRALTLEPLARLGQLGLDGAATLGRFGIFLGQTLFWLVVPPFKACTDNASMIAYAGIQRLARGDNDAQNLLMSPHTSLPQSTKKGRGKRES